MYRFESSVKSYLQKYGITKDKKIIVAFSGGSDSLSLLVALKHLDFNNLVAVYVNHNLRESSELLKEMRLNTFNTQKLSVPFVVKELSIGELERSAKNSGIGIEAAGRNARHSILKEVLKLQSADFIATGHTRSDCDEWDIISFFRGSLDTRSIPEFNPPFIKPLINLSHNDTEQYCKENGFEFSFDTSNLSNNYLRNAVRNVLIPQIEDVFPSFSETFKTRRDIYSNYNFNSLDIKEEKYFNIDVYSVSLKEFKSLFISEQCDCIYCILNKFKKTSNGGRISSKDILNIINMINSNDNKVLLINGVYIFKTKYNLTEEKIITCFKSDVDKIEVGKTYPTGSKLKKLKNMKVPKIFRSLV